MSHPPNRDVHNSSPASYSMGGPGYNAYLVPTFPADGVSSGSLSRRSSQVSSSSSLTVQPPIASSSSSSSTMAKDSQQRDPKRRHICTYPGCDKAFTTSGHLARHVRTHTGEKAFQCTFEGCTSRFSRHDNMLQHYRSHICKNSRKRKPTSSTGRTRPRVAPNLPGPNSASEPTSPQSPIFVHSQYSMQSIGASAQPLSAIAGAQYENADLGQSTAAYYQSSSPGSSTSSAHGLNVSLPEPVTQGYYNGPPLPSPSLLARPRSAVDPAFEAAAHQQPMPTRPVLALTHRHSYSTLPLHPTEPITPLEEYENPLTSAGGSPSISLAASSPFTGSVSLPPDRQHAYGIPRAHGSGTLMQLGGPYGQYAQGISSPNLSAANSHQNVLNYVSQLPPVPSAPAYFAPDYIPPQRLFSPHSSVMHPQNSIAEFQPSGLPALAEMPEQYPLGSQARHVQLPYQPFAQAGARTPPPGHAGGQHHMHFQQKQQQQQQQSTYYGQQDPIDKETIDQALAELTASAENSPQLWPQPLFRSSTTGSMPSTQDYAQQRQPGASSAGSSAQELSSRSSAGPEESLQNQRTTAYPQWYKHPQ